MELRLQNHFECGHHKTQELHARPQGRPSTEQEQWNCSLKV